MDSEMTMTPISGEEPPPLFNAGTQRVADNGYDDQRQMLEKKSNNDSNNMAEYATPLSDVMDSQEIPLNNPMYQQSMPQPPHPQPMPQQMVQYIQQPQPEQEAPKPAPKYPLNMSEEHYDALIVGAIAIVVFSKPVQEKLRNVLPQAFSETGSRTMIGIGATGLLAAVAYHFGKKFLKK